MQTSERRQKRRLGAGNRTARPWETVIIGNRIVGYVRCIRDSHANRRWYCKYIPGPDAEAIDLQWQYTRDAAIQQIADYVSRET